MLYVVATPIGDINEISVRALKVLSEADVIICESTKETSKLLRAHQIKANQYETLNEHSTQDDLKNLLNLCKEKTVALVSDCGTPGFCDPGADLVKICLEQKVKVSTVLGASSLMGLLSLCGAQLTQFLFRGFLPAETEARKVELLKLKNEIRPIVLMDTPYRLKKTLSDMKDHLSDREFFLACNLNSDDEFLVRGTIDQLIKSLPHEKAEFMLLIYGTAKSQTQRMLV